MTEPFVTKILLATDGSSDAALAAKAAADLAKTTGAELHLVHAYLEMPEIEAKVRAFDPRAADDALGRAERALEGRAHELEELLGSRLQPEIAVGDAAYVLLEEAGEGDEQRALIAVGSRGLGPVGRMRLGSTSTKVLRAARGPVLVCPLRGQETGDEGDRLG